jgi:hypothetical protein
MNTIRETLWICAACEVHGRQANIRDGEMRAHLEEVHGIDMNDEVNQ